MAIDPKELRIGSHVEYMGERWEVAYITPKNKVLYYALFQKNCPLLEVFPLEVNPIPITPELLAEIGFKYHEFNNGKLWKLDFPDLYKAYMYLEYDEDTTHRYNFRMWNMKEVEVYGAVEYLHELENWVYLIYGKELITD